MAMHTQCGNAQTILQCADNMAMCRQYGNAQAILKFEGNTQTIRQRAIWQDNMAIRKLYGNEHT